jgi:hypothetical protein
VTSPAYGSGVHQQEVERNAPSAARPKAPRSRPERDPAWAGLSLFLR